MYADAISGYKFVERNVPKRDAFKMVQYEGFPAARIQLSIDMGGARDDWIRDGISVMDKDLNMVKPNRERIISIKRFGQE